MSHRHSDSGIPWLFNRIQELEKENTRFRKALETIRELDISVGAWPIAHDALEGNVDDNPPQEDSL